MAFLAPAADDIVAFIKFGNEERDIGRVVLAVAVTGADDFTASIVETGAHGGGLTKIAAKSYHSYSRVGFGKLGNDRKTAVSAAIIHENYLIVVTAGQGIVD